jgi:NADH dehydrogenase
MILVSGGTGFIGAATVRELVRRGERVAVLGRDSRKIEERFAGAVEAREADVRDPVSLATAMGGAQVVINAVQFPGSPVENRRKGWTFEETDLKATRNQVEAARDAGVRRFVYVSGVGAARDAEKHWFRYKWEAEQYLQASGLEWVVVRPTWVFGPDDVSLNRFLAMARFLPFLPMFGDGKQQMQPVFIDDVARILADASRVPEAAGCVLEAGGPDVMSMDDVVRAALEVQGRKRAVLHQPAALGKMLGTIASALPGKPLSADAIDFITQPAVADNTKLMQVLRPRLTPLREGLATYLRPAPPAPSP